MSSLIIKNGLVISPANNLNKVCDLGISDGRIAYINDIPSSFKASHHIDAQDCIVMPGIVDLAVNCCEPGFESKGSIQSECQAANRGGITSLCTPPTTRPIADNPAVIDLIMDRAQKVSANVIPIGAITKGLQGQEITDMAALKEAGCTIVSNARQPIMNTRVLRHAFEYAATFDLTVFVHPQDAHLAANGIMHEGLVSARMGLPGIPSTAETVALSTALLLQRETGVRCHFCRLSSRHSIELLHQAKSQGFDVTADVAIHHLLLTDQDMQGYNSYCHVSPPLRGLEDQKALLNGINEGIVNTICSDHQPHESTAKQVPLMAAEPGISGVETLLPLTHHLVESGHFDLSQMVSLLATQPANIVGQPIGCIDINASADICIFNPDTNWQLKKEAMLSQGLNSPFNDWPLTGEVQATIQQGQIAYLKAS